MTTQRERAIEIIRKQIGHMIPRDNHYQSDAIAAAVYDALLAAGIIREWPPVDEPFYIKVSRLRNEIESRTMELQALICGDPRKRVSFPPPPTESTEP